MQHGVKRRFVDKPNVFCTQQEATSGLCARTFVPRKGPWMVSVHSRHLLEKYLVGYCRQCGRSRICWGSLLTMHRTTEAEIFTFVQFVTTLLRTPNGKHCKTFCLTGSIAKHFAPCKKTWVPRRRCKDSTSCQVKCICCRRTKWRARLFLHHFISPSQLVVSASPNWRLAIKREYFAADLHQRGGGGGNQSEGE